MPAILFHTHNAVSSGRLGIAGFDAAFGRDRQFYLTDLAEALASPGKQRDLDAAAGTGMDEIQRAENLSSTRSVDRIRDLS